MYAELRDVNQKTFKDMEAEWASKIWAGRKVDVHIDIEYGAGVAPSVSMSCSTYIDGEKDELAYIRT